MHKIWIYRKNRLGQWTCEKGLVMVPVWLGYLLEFIFIGIFHKDPFWVFCMTLLLGIVAAAVNPILGKDDYTIPRSE